MGAMTRAVGYVRVSKVRGRAGDSFLSRDLQREQIAAAARREGLEVVEILEELDRSGGRPGPPALSYAEAASDRVAAVNKAEVDLEEARERHGGRYELVARLWLQEWGWAEGKEYVSRMVRSVVVSKGRESLSGRAEVELR